MEIRSSKEGALVPAQVSPRSHPGVELAEGRLVIRVALLTGARSRTKLFLVSGLSAQSVNARLEPFRLA